MARPHAVAVVAAVVLLTTSCSSADTEPESTVTASVSSQKPAAASDQPTVARVIASGLVVPWGIAFLPDGSALVTERDSKRLLRIPPSGEPIEVGVIDAAAPQGEGGLLGVAASPTYDTDHEIFLYLTTAEDNRVVRTTLDAEGPGSGLGEETVILAGIPNGFIHDGGRLLFGPDGYLYVSTGEAGEPDLAQDRESLGGKILRITRAGEPAPGNPYDSPVWSWGHRNIQGLAFDEGGRLWASEFGDSTWDELNLIEKGRNYGWPVVEGHGGDATFTNPAVVWSPDEASPSGLAYTEGAFWLGALRGQRLWRVPVNQGVVGEPQAFFVGDYGRMRSVALAPDGMLWVTTSNRDGRGEPGKSDDRILAVDPGQAG